MQGGLFDHTNHHWWTPHPSLPSPLKEFLLWPLWIFANSSVPLGPWCNLFRHHHVCSSKILPPLQGALRGRGSKHSPLHSLLASFSSFHRSKDENKNNPKYSEVSSNSAASRDLSLSLGESDLRDLVTMRSKGALESSVDYLFGLRSYAMNNI